MFGCGHRVQRTNGEPADARKLRIDLEALLREQLSRPRFVTGLRLEDNVLRLARLLGTTTPEREAELLVVTEVASGPVALAIDDIGERFETMLRPPAGLLRAMPGIAGTCVLGDGTVAIVLDLEALVE